MDKHWFQWMIVILFLCFSPLTVFAQGEDDDQNQNSSDYYSQDQLEQLLAPIALYPDQLLTQVLTAATHATDVTEADRWLQDPQNAALQGDDLVAALDEQDWDTSVKALVPFPQVLQMMDDNLQWTVQLGKAVQMNQAGVMSAIQQLRSIAEAAGQLQSNQDQTVSTQDQDIQIQPADAQAYYVPAYDPAVVYGGWQYHGAYRYGYNNRKQFNNANGFHNTNGFTNSPHQIANNYHANVPRATTNTAWQNSRNYRGYAPATQIHTTNATPHPAAPMFESFSQGAQSHAHAVRGAASRGLSGGRGR